MGNYRDKLDIVADILNVTRRNAKKTQIMYEANLSYRVLQKYLADMSETSLICFKEETKRYTLTEKGQEFLEAYRKYSTANKYFERRTTDIKAKKQNLEKLINK